MKIIKNSLIFLVRWIIMWSLILWIVFTIGFAFDGPVDPNQPGIFNPAAANWLSKFDIWYVLGINLVLLGLFGLYLIFSTILIRRKAKDN